MSGRIPRSARVPHTEKRPDRCPHCGSTAITRKGTRRKKIEIVPALALLLVQARLHADAGSAAE
jgi:transposase